MIFRLSFTAILGFVSLFFFFFQAEDGIRDHCVTGVQTCALPIWGPGARTISNIPWSENPVPVWPDAPNLTWPAPTRQRDQPEENLVFPLTRICIRLYKYAGVAMNTGKTFRQGQILRLVTGERSEEHTSELQSHS